MIRNQNDQSKNDEKKHLTYKRDVNGALSFEGGIVQLKLIREGLKYRLWLLIFLLILNVIVSIFSSWPLIRWWPREGWQSFLLSLVINGVAFWIGYAALIKVREIQISR